MGHTKAKDWIYTKAFSAQNTVVTLAWNAQEFEGHGKYQSWLFSQKHHTKMEMSKTTDARIFQKPRCHLKIIAARRVDMKTCSELRTGKYLVPPYKFDRCDHSGALNFSTPIIIIIIIIIIINCNWVVTRWHSPYNSTDKTNKNKYT